MLSDQSTVGDSNRTEADGAGRFGNRSAPAASCSHFSHIHIHSFRGDRHTTFLTVYISPSLILGQYPWYLVILIKSPVLLIDLTMIDAVEAHIVASN